MEKKILLFGFNTLPEILSVRDVAALFGAEIIVVKREDYNKSLEVLAGLEIKGKRKQTDRVMGILTGRMAVICGLDDQLDELVSMLMGTAAGAGCLKAIITPHNRTWNPVQLYEQLLREHKAIWEQKKSKK